MYIYIALTLAFLFSFSLDSRAQNVALKTNLAYDAVAAANLGLEFGLAPRWTMDISGNYMPWKFYTGTSRKHAFVQPEARYWFCALMGYRSILQSVPSLELQPFILLLRIT